MQKKTKPANNSEKIDAGRTDWLLFTTDEFCTEASFWFCPSQMPQNNYDSNNKKQYTFHFRGDLWKVFGSHKHSAFINNKIN